MFQLLLIIIIIIITIIIVIIIVIIIILLKSIISILKIRVDLTINLDEVIGLNYLIHLII